MPTKEYLLPEDTSLIEEAALCLREKLLIRLLRRLGCRVGEVLGLEVKHFDFSQRQVKIEHEKLRIRLNCPACDAGLAKSSIFCPKCGVAVERAIKKEKETRRLRKIPVDNDTLEMVRKYIKGGGVTVVNGRKLLFARTRQWAWGVVVACAKRAGFNQIENPENERKHHVSPHKFRDAFAINAIKKRPTLDDARLLQELLGHSSINTTLRYRKVAGTELQEFYDDLLKKENGEQDTTPRKSKAKA